MKAFRIYILTQMKYSV